MKNTVPVITVLKTGGEYTAEHVGRLKRQLDRHNPLARFMCITDDLDVAYLRGVHVLTMRDAWPGWWSKLELFKYAGPLLYLDLDTDIRRSVRPFLDAAAARDFIALRDFMPGTSGRLMGSGVMAWRGDMSSVYDAFKAAPDKHMREYRSSRWWGDQGFIERHTDDATRAYWQDVLPPQEVVSYKLHCKPRPPRAARLICYHGKPKPWEI